jgi:hypothetical protein
MFLEIIYWSKKANYYKNELIILRCEYSKYIRKKQHELFRREQFIKGTKTPKAVKLNASGNSLQTPDENLQPMWCLSPDDKVYFKHWRLYDFKKFPQ